jgi:hypothetical protein
MKRLFFILETEIYTILMNACIHESSSGLMANASFTSGFCFLVAE